MKGCRIFLLAAVLVSVLIAVVATTPVGDVAGLVASAVVCGAAWWAALGRAVSGDRRPWVLVAASQALWLAGDLLDLVDAASIAGVADVFSLGGYPVLTAAMVQMAQRRAPGRLRSAVLDGFTLAVAAGMAAWQFVIAPVFDRGLDLVEAVPLALYPVADVALLAGVLVVALSPGTRTAPGRLLLTAVGLYLTVDLGHHVLADGGLVERSAAGLLLGNALIVGAALHPASAELTRPGHQVTELHPARVLFLGLALMTTPILTTVPGGVDLPAPAVLFGTGTCAAFLLARFAIAVREQERAQAQVAFQSRHDPLTGLANRSVLSDRLRRALPGSGYPVTVLYLDLDGFKAVNDAHGHDAGDAVLRAVAMRLSAAVRESDLVVRLGGDEFVLLCPGVLADDAMRLAERIIHDVAEPVSFRGHPLTVGVSIGINALVDRPGIGPTAVLRAADAAMEDAKRCGRGRWMLADEKLTVAG